MQRRRRRKLAPGAFPTVVNASSEVLDAAIAPSRGDGPPAELQEFASRAYELWEHALQNALLFRWARDTSSRSSYRPDAMRVLGIGRGLVLQKQGRVVISSSPAVEIQVDRSMNEPVANLLTRASLASFYENRTALWTAGLPCALLAALGLIRAVNGVDVPEVTASTLPVIFLGWVTQNCWRGMRSARPNVDLGQLMTHRVAVSAAMGDAFDRCTAAYESLPPSVRDQLSDVDWFLNSVMNHAEDAAVAVSADPSTIQAELDASRVRLREMGVDPGPGLDSSEWRIETKKPRRRSEGVLRNTTRVVLATSIQSDTGDPVPLDVARAVAVQACRLWELAVQEHLMMRLLLHRRRAFPPDVVQSTIALELLSDVPLEHQMALATVGWPPTSNQVEETHREASIAQKNAARHSGLYALATSLVAAASVASDPLARIVAGTPAYLVITSLAASSAYETAQRFRERNMHFATRERLAVVGPMADARNAMAIAWSKLPADLKGEWDVESLTKFVIAEARASVHAGLGDEPSPHEIRREWNASRGRLHQLRDPSKGLERVMGSESLDPRSSTDRH